MNWKIRFHPVVVKLDLPNIPSIARKQILHDIRKKLSINPEQYGEPLRKELFGYWKLRVGDYRVIYKIKKLELIILILKLGQRKDKKVYREMLQRTKKTLWTE